VPVNESYWWLLVYIGVALLIVAFVLSMWL
jgi:hypothetical protein